MGLGAAACGFLPCRGAHPNARVGRQSIPDSQRTIQPAAGQTSGSPLKCRKRRVRSRHSCPPVREIRPRPEHRYAASFAARGERQETDRKFCKGNALETSSLKLISLECDPSVVRTECLTKKDIVSCGSCTDSTSSMLFRHIAKNLVNFNDPSVVPKGSVFCTMGVRATHL